MEKMLFKINGIGRLRTTATEIIKIDDAFLDSSQIMMVLAKYRLASEEIMVKIIEMTIKGVMNSAATTGMLPVLTDKIVDQGSKDRMYHPRTF